MTFNASFASHFETCAWLRIDVYGALDQTVALRIDGYGALDQTVALRVQVTSVASMGGGVDVSATP